MKWTMPYPRSVLVRRLLILLAVLIVLTAVAGSLAPVPVAPPQPTPSPTATGRPAAPGAHARPPARDVRAAVSAASDRGERRIAARVGDQVSITVMAGDAIDSVALGDLDVEPLEPGVPARFDLLADAVGRYPLVLLDERRRIGTLIVR
jgi:hypothetical protein